MRLRSNLNKNSDTNDGILPKLFQLNLKTDLCRLFSSSECTTGCNYSSTISYTHTHTHTSFPPSKLAHFAHKQKSPMPTILLWRISQRNRNCGVFVPNGFIGEERRANRSQNKSQLPENTHGQWCSTSPAKAWQSPNAHEPTRWQ